MKKINDRILLGALAGLGGNLVKTAIDEVSLQAKLSQRSFRSTAAGVWVGKRRRGGMDHDAFRGNLATGSIAVITSM